MLDFFKELSVSLPGDAKAIAKSGIGAIRLKVADLFEDVVRVCDIEKGTVEVTMSFTGVLKTFSW